MSDLHLEFSQGDMEIPDLPQDKDTVLVLAGDIGLAKRKSSYRYFIEEMSYRFKEVIFVLGNHEHYGTNFPTTHNRISNELIEFDNVSVLEKGVTRLEDVAFIGATLWSDMDGHNVMTMHDAQCGMNDYSTIRTGTLDEPWKRKLTPIDTIQDHMSSKIYIMELIKIEKEKGNKVVVVTHMAPSFQSVSDNYKNSSLNGAYCTELFEHVIDLGEAQPELWVHGHLHNTSDYQIGNTRVICNPRGYYPTDLNPDFDASFTVEL